MRLQGFFKNFGNAYAKIKNQFLCKIAGNPWKSILKTINQNALFFPGNFNLIIKTSDEIIFLYKGLFLDD
jgi:hypothetical protein